MTFEQLEEFEKDLKKLLKKYNSLNEDLEILKIALADEPNAAPPFSFTINNLGIDTCIIKVKKIACRALKGRGVKSGLRLVYAYFPDEERIVLVELYHKSDTETEDRERILSHFL